MCKAARQYGGCGRGRGGGGGSSCVAQWQRAVATRGNDATAWTVMQLFVTGLAHCTAMTAELQSLLLLSAGAHPSLLRQYSAVTQLCSALAVAVPAQHSLRLAATKN